MFLSALVQKPLPWNGCCNQRTSPQRASGSWEAPCFPHSRLPLGRSPRQVGKSVHPHPVCNPQCTWHSGKLQTLVHQWVCSQLNPSGWEEMPLGVCWVARDDEYPNVIFVTTQFLKPVNQVSLHDVITMNRSPYLCRWKLTELWSTVLSPFKYLISQRAQEINL